MSHKQPGQPPSGAIDRLLGAPPFGLSDEDKRPLFAAAMAEAFRHHFENNELFRTHCRKLGLAPELEAPDPGLYPYLPAAVFKSGLLVSVPADRLTAEVHSSATSGAPSRIAVDRTTAKRQSLVSSRVMAEYLGHHRRPFLIADADPGASTGREIPARAAAARGFLVFADAVDYAFGEDGGRLVTDPGRLCGILERLERSGCDVCVFGFTHLLYTKLIKPLQEMGKMFSLPPGSRVALIGGWKRLRDERVTREVFGEAVRRTLAVPDDSVIDFYGFTEQMGLVYGGAGRGPKTVSAYAEIIIRDFDTLRPAPDGREGLVQVLTPVPHSYPGISVLTDDVGRILGRGRDESGRWGTRFEILGRAESAEARGCGNIPPPAGR